MTDSAKASSGPQSGKRVGYQYLARLDRKEDRRYVDDINWEKIYYSR